MSRTKRCTVVILAALLALSCLTAGTAAAPIKELSGSAGVTDLHPDVLTARQEADKRSSAAIVKHVKPLCTGSICNHAAFYN